MAVLVIGAPCKASTGVSGTTQTGISYDLEVGTEVDISSYSAGISFHMFRAAASNLPGLPTDTTLYIPKGKVYAIVSGSASSAEFQKGMVSGTAIALL